MSLGAQLDQAELQCLQRQWRLCGALVEPAQGVRRAPRLRAANADPVAAAADGGAVSLRDLPQVFVQRAAEVGQLSVAAGQLQGQGTRGRGARLLDGGIAHAGICTEARVRISPRSVLVSAAVMRTSIIWPMSRGSPAKFTMRLFSVRPFMS
ncbi:hypothetical protein CDEF62S_02566 [Castellaniella defragrans]